MPADDLAVLRFADYGCEAYGCALIVNPQLAAAKPEAGEGIRAGGDRRHAPCHQGPCTRRNRSRRPDGRRLARARVERLNTVIRDNILTAEVKHDGIGAIDPARFERSIDQIAEDFKFQKRPSVSDIFDDSFLPPVIGRLIN